MSTSRISHSAGVTIAANVFGAICVGFGINAILRPLSALQPFEFHPPTSAADTKLVENLMIIYGVRDVFWGLAIHIAAYFGSRKTLGWILIAGSGVAFADGIICKMEGKGEWNHWGYAPMLTVVGALSLGILDKRM